MNEVKKLSLKEALTALQQTKIYQEMHFALEQEKKKQQEEAKKKAQALKKKRLRNAISWLSSTYPKCFNSQSPKPLKIGIDKDILSHKMWPASNTFLREVLAFYVGSPYYQLALLKEQKRVSLEGQAIQEITDHQKAIAEERLKKIKTKKINPRVSNHAREQRPINAYEQLHQNEADNQNA